MSRHRDLLGVDLGSEGSQSDSSQSFISAFVQEKGHEFFCAVDEDFIQDDFNLTNLNTLVPHYEDALDVILDLDDAEGKATSLSLLMFHVSCFMFHILSFMRLTSFFMFHSFIFHVLSFMPHLSRFSLHFSCFTFLSFMQRTSRLKCVTL